MAVKGPPEQGEEDCMRGQEVLERREHTVNATKLLVTEGRALGPDHAVAQTPIQACTRCA